MAAGGSQHSLALTSAGRVLAWGHDTFGQLGDGSKASTSVPVLPSWSRRTAWP
jgi:alpha-tubulin suppressor-like RCC1 family protein